MFCGVSTQVFLSASVFPASFPICTSFTCLSMFLFFSYFPFALNSTAYCRFRYVSNLSHTFFPQMYLSYCWYNLKFLAYSHIRLYIFVNEFGMHSSIKRMRYQTLDSQPIISGFSVNMYFISFPLPIFFFLFSFRCSFFLRLVRLYLFLLNFRMNCCIKQYAPTVEFSCSAFYVLLFVFGIRHF